MDKRVSTPLLAREPAAPAEITTELPPGVFRALVGLYALMIGAFVMAFRRDGETLFQIAICIFYGVMYFGVPALLLGTRPASGTRRSYSMTVPKIDTFTGPLTQRDALAQILSVPAALARRAKKWKPVFREKARQNNSLIIGRDSEIAPDDLAFGAVVMAFIIMNARG